MFLENIKSNHWYKLCKRDKRFIMVLGCIIVACISLFIYIISQLCNFPINYISVPSPVFLMFLFFFMAVFVSWDIAIDN